MDEALGKQWAMAEQDDRISATIDRDQSRIRNFISKHVADREDAEDILQDVFYELVEAYRLMKPVEQVTAWLFRVARNRIIDRFRKKRQTVGVERAAPDEEERFALEELLPSPDAGPDAAYGRTLLLEALEDALDELPEEQREAFVDHEMMGYSFKELSERTGVSVNTLLSRKHYAVLFLRKRLQAIYDEFREV